MERHEGVNYKGLEELEYAVINLGMQRVLYELSSIINSYEADREDEYLKQETINMRHRYASQFSHDLHHTTAGDRNEREEHFKMNNA